jgi:hypothetical protein
VSRPPTKGAITGAVSAGQVSRAIVRTSSPFSVTRSTLRRPTGTIIAPPTPCSTRITVSWVRSVLRAQSTEATVNTTIAPRKMWRAPKRTESQPLSGMATATVSR